MSCAVRGRVDKREFSEKKSVRQNNKCASASSALYSMFHPIQLMFDLIIHLKEFKQLEKRRFLDAVKSTSRIDLTVFLHDM